MSEDAVTFEWEEDKTATYYDFVLYSMNHQGEWEEYEYYSTAQSGFTWRLSDGRYRGVLKAYNSRIHNAEYPQGVYSESEPVEFSLNKVTYEISYDANLGELAPDTQIKHQGLGCVLSREEPQREGYIFLGWSEKMDAKVPEYSMGDLCLKDASVVLYAVWRDENLKGVLGDANEDEVVNIKDVTEIQKHLAGILEISQWELVLADTDQNGEVNIKDATAIQKHLAEIPTGFPIGEYI